MKPWATFMDRMSAAASPSIPPQRLGTIKRGLRRRLNDAVEDVFQRACLMGDLETAAELLGVLEAMHARRKERFGSERRISEGALPALREELRRRVRAKASKEKMLAEVGAG